MTANTSINELNDGHITEAIDRLHVACVYIDEFLGQHPLLSSVPEFRNEIDKASDTLAGLYQKVASFHSVKEFER